MANDATASTRAWGVILGLLMAGPTLVATAQATPPLMIGPVAAPPAPAKPWPYDRFGAPGKVVWRHEMPDLGVTQVRFANGVRLNIKSTTFAKDQIVVSVRFGQGLAGAPIGRPFPAWMLGAFVAGGTREMTYQELGRSLTGAVLAAQLSAADNAFVLSGLTRGQDMTRQLQLMTALIARPGFRPEAVLRLQAALAARLPASDLTPGAVMGRDLPERLHGGDARWRPIPRAEDLAAARPGDLAAALEPALRSGAMEVTVVGDVTVARAIAEVAATLATLPPRAEPGPASLAARTVHPPVGGGAPTVAPHRGRPEQAIAYVEWPTADFQADPHGARVLNLTSAVLQSRLTDRIRADDLAPYPVGSAAVSSSALTGFGYLEAGAEIAPWKTDAFYRILADVVGDLGRSPPGPDELTRLLEPMAEAYAAKRQTNAFWIGGLSGSQADPAMLAGLRDGVADESAVTGAEIAAACQKYLTPERAWKLIVRAADAPTPTLAPVAGPATPRRPGTWAQADSDLAADSDVRFGILANGLRYAIKRNTNPSGQTSLRFRIGAGSLQERDDQRGLAHFLEHMAFRGSSHVAQNEMVRILERIGLAFGPDINAFTQQDQTFFKLDLPQSDNDRLDTGLMLMREIASELRLDPAAMDAERGVILSEERLAESPAREADKLEQAFFFDGQPAGRRDPMGVTQVLRTAPATLVRAYYDAWYRPDDATLIVVGDIDVDAAEAKIKTHFGDWRGRGPAGPAVDPGTPKPRGETPFLLARDGLPLSQALVWVRPFDTGADGFARQRRQLVEDLGLDVLNRRLTRMTAMTTAPFISAGVSRANSARSGRLTEVWALPAEGGLEPSLTALVEEQRRIAQFGVDEAEFREVLKARRDNIGSMAASAPTAASAALADRLLAAVNDDLVIQGPIQALAQFDAEAATVTRADVNAALKIAFDGQGPLIVVTSPKPLAGGGPAIRALYDVAAARPVTAPVAQVVKTWPYDSFGAPGKVVFRRDLPDLGVTQVRFANGVRLNIKPTTFAKNQIQVTAHIGEGLIGLAPNHAAPAWLVGAWVPGGTRELTTDELQHALDGVGVTANAALADDALVLSGITGPRDLARQLQLFAALISRPGYRPEAVEHDKNLIAVASKTIDFTPANVLAVSLPPLLHRGDRRWATLPTAAELAAARPSDLPALLDSALATGSLEVTVVGEVTVERAIQEVGGTLGALPPRGDPRPVPAASPTLRPPAGGGPPIVLRHRGRPDQAIAYVQWPTNDFYADPHEAHVLVIAAGVLRNRLIDRIRVTESATYAPAADSTAISEMIGFGYLQASVEIPPAKIDGFYRDIDMILDDMSRTPPSPDEVLRARAPLLETEAKARETMDFWSYYLGHAQADPREIWAIRRKIADFNSVTAEEITAVCRKYLTHGRAWKLIVRAAEPRAG